MQSLPQANGPQSIGALHFINETDQIISESLYAQKGQKRGLESDGESDEITIPQPDFNGTAVGLGEPTARPGKKTKGRVKIRMEFIENKLRRYTTFSKRKTGIMKKVFEIQTFQPIPSFICLKW